ncbi:MAG TPA: hypothetical protein VFC78_24395 [Tepidisphaeraceae bacterium]|nr:hypothetical protein [Tepidisphaeraceae bacterium]
MQSVLSDLAAYNHAPTALAVPDLAQQLEQRGGSGFPDELAAGYYPWESDAQYMPTAEEEAAHFQHWQESESEVQAMTIRQALAELRENLPAGTRFTVQTEVTETAQGDSVIQFSVFAHRESGMLASCFHDDLRQAVRTVLASHTVPATSTTAGAISRQVAELVA